MLSFENKGGVQSPKRFLDDNIEEKIRSLFHYEYFSNDIFGIKYKLKKKAGQSYEFDHTRNFRGDPAKTLNKVTLKASNKRGFHPKIDISGEYKLEKPAELYLRLDLDRIYGIFSLSSQLRVEKGKIKDLSVCPSLEDLDKKIKVQFQKNFSSRKQEPLAISIQNISSFKNKELYKRGIEIINEEKIVNFQEFKGFNMVKFGLESAGYFGFASSHSFSLKSPVPKIDSLRFFYKTSKNLLSIGWTETHKQLQDYHITAITKIENNLEVGVKLNSQHSPQKEHLQLGLSYSSQIGRFKFKITDAWRGMFFHSFRVNKNLQTMFCCNFSLCSENQSQSNLFPFGIKLEISDD